MAKNKKSSHKLKTAPRAKRAPVKAKTKKAASKVQAPVAAKAGTSNQKPAPPQERLAADLHARAGTPAPTSRIWRPSPLERLAVVMGGVLFIFGLVGLLQPQAAVHDTVTDDVKKQSIPMSMDDFKDDPAIQHAIQKQLGNKIETGLTPVQPQTNAPQAAGGGLQEPASNLQAQ